MNRNSFVVSGVCFLALAISCGAAADQDNAALMTATMINSNGACTSQGPWTQNAITQANAIYESAMNLKNDPNCKGLAASLGQLGFSADDQGLKEANASESMMGELSALRTVLKGNSGAAQALNPILASATLDSITKVAGSPAIGGPAVDVLGARYLRTADRGINMLNQLSAVLPKYQQCLQKRPDFAIALVTGGVRLASTYASGGPGIGVKFGDTLGNFLNALQESHFAGIHKKLNLQKLWSDMSCLVETTQAQYCSVADGFDLLQNQKDSMAQKVVGSPLEGYYMMVREVPQISAWLQRIQMGVEPRLTTQAAFKTQTWTSMAQMFTDTANLPALYWENYNTVYASLPTLAQKQANIRDLLKSLVGAMAASARSGTNFFTTTVPAQFMPFYLIGRSEIPEQVIAAGAQKIDTEDYLLSPTLTPELQNPDLLMKTIYDRLEEITAQALMTGAAYFRTRMSVDPFNLVDDAITGSALTTRQSLTNVRNYLQGLYMRLSGDPEARPTLLSIADTLGHIDRVLNLFKAIDADAQSFNVALTSGRAGYDLRDMSGYGGSAQTEMKDKFNNLIGAVYIEFNLLLQWDSFITMRMSKYVQMDYAQRLKHDDLSRYANQLLITSGRTMLDRLQQYQQFNIAQAEADLSNANVINMNNLDQVEKLTADYLQDYLFDLDTRAGHNFAYKTKHGIVNYLTGGMINTTVLFAAKQDVNNEAENTRAKVCIQTLGFKDYSRFYGLCSGAVLKATITPLAVSRLRLEYKYDDLFANRWSGDSYFNKALNNGTLLRGQFDAAPLFAAKNRFSQVCGVRDYFRNNLVAWMINSFNSSAP